MLAHYLIPLAPFVLIGLNSALCLFFFLSTRHETRALNSRWRRRQASQEAAAEELKAQVAELSARLLDAEDRTGVLVPPTPPKSGMNLNKRSQVIHMSRRGEQVEKIAASLNLPQREVELLLKVQRSVIYRSNDLKSKTLNS